MTTKLILVHKTSFINNAGCPIPLVSGMLKYCLEILFSMKIYIFNDEG